MSDDDTPHPDIDAAIKEGVKAGVFRRAGRLNPGTEKIWNELAEPHTKKAAAILRKIKGEEA